MQKNILVTGCSSGLGLALTNYYLKKDFNVYGVSRNNPNIENNNFHFIPCDLSKLSNIKNDLDSFIKAIENIEIAFLNAGMLGNIDVMGNLEVNHLKEVMDLNVYANKELLDILKETNVKNIIATSSGASVNGSKGWGAYSLSKASLNMLINLYSKELTNTKLISLAPGVIETPMTDIIRFEIDDEKFTSAKTLKNGPIQSPKDTAVRIDKFFERIEEFESGSFIDIRNV